MATRVQAPGGAAPQSDMLVSSSVLTRSPLTSDQFEVDRLEGRSQAPSDFSTSAFQENFAGVPVSSGSMPLVQPKLVVGPPNDKYEQEADRVANQVMGMPDPKVLWAQRAQLQTGRKDELDKIQLKTFGEMLQQMKISGEDNDLHMKISQKSPLSWQSVIRQKTARMQKRDSLSIREASHLEETLRDSKGRGAPLSEGTRTFFEPRMHFDFSRVRMHSDSNAAKVNRQLNARAFTHGSDIYFGAGQYRPSSIAGKHLISHELVHVVQQNSNSSYSLESSRRNSVELLGYPIKATSSYPLISRFSIDSVGSFLKSAVRGASQIPGDIFHGAVRTVEGLNFFDSKRQLEIGYENERALKQLISVYEEREKIQEALEIVAEDYKEKVAGLVVGRGITTVAISGIVSRIAARIGASGIFRLFAGGPFTLLVIQGVLQRASRASRQLKSSNNRLYQKLHQNELEMLWFLIEPHAPEIYEAVDNELKQGNDIL